MKKIKKERLKRLLVSDGLILLAVLAAAVLALGTKLINSLLPEGYYLPYCLCHDLLHLYCPFCGCTRAGLALFRLDFAASFSANPLVILFCFALAFYNGVSLCQIWCEKEIPDLRRYGPFVLVLLVLFAVLRNILMIFFGIDTLGELVGFWR